MKSIAKPTTYDRNGLPLPLHLNGAFTVTFPWGVTLLFAGAPFRNADRMLDAFRVKCATEQTGRFDADIPCEDFSVPTEEDMLKAVEAAIEAAFAGQPVFAGCAGGIGRTGTFLSVVLKALGAQVEAPMKADLGWVGMVRRVYLRHAVETDAQKRLIEDIDVSRIRRRLKWLWLKAVARRFFRGR